MPSSSLGAIVLVFVAGLTIGVWATKLVAEFGGGFWSIVNFTMQMALAIVGGFVVASSPPVARLTSRLASIPKTGRGAVAFMAATFAMLSSLLSWRLSLNDRSAVRDGRRQVVGCASRLDGADR